MSELDYQQNRVRPECHVRLGPVLDLLTPALRHVEPVLVAAANACGAGCLDQMLLLVATSVVRRAGHANSSASPKSRNVLLP
jgi:hypothetical protein